MLSYQKERARQAQRVDEWNVSALARERGNEVAMRKWTGETGLEAGGVLQTRLCANTRPAFPIGKSVADSKAKRIKAVKKAGIFSDM